MANEQVVSTINFFLHTQHNTKYRIHLRCPYSEKFSLTINNITENLVCGQAIVRPSNFTSEYQLRMRSRGLPDSTKGLPLLLSR